MTFADQVQGAVSAHGMWKARLRQAIESGKSDFKVEVVRQDNQCDFGKWLYGEAKRDHGQEPQYEKVRALHAEFHAEAARVLGAAVAGKKAEAEAAMGIGGKFSHTSSSLITALVLWEKAAA